MSIDLRDRLYVGGEWIRASGGEEAIINPATEAVIALAPVGAEAEVEASIAAAREAFDRGTWPRMSTSERADVLAHFVDWLADQRTAIVDLIVREAGATQMLAAALHFDVPMKHARYLLDEARRLEPQATRAEVTPSFDGRLTLGAAFTHFDPIGVVSAITPYNFPFFLNIVKVVHALVMGNTVVLKPSPYTPFEALVFAQAAHAVGLPRGVLNVVTGGVEEAARLTSDPRVDMVTFTGSDRVGEMIAAQAAPTLKKVHLELGGKSALIVRADADIEAAAHAGVAGFTIHCGQGCALTTRMLVHSSVREQYVARVAELASSLKIGDPADPQVALGPLIRAQARERVARYVEIGRQQGARLVTGGAIPEGFDRGFFYRPTLFDQVDNRAAIAQDEIFGPVGVVIDFDTDEEAIELANASAFGLSGGIFSGDTGRAYEMAKQLRTGGVAINGGAGTMLSGAPFGGIKRSGYGRENGREGLLEFANAKSISFHAG